MCDDGEMDSSSSSWVSRSLYRSLEIACTTLRSPFLDIASTPSECSKAKKALSMIEISS